MIKRIICSLVLLFILAACSRGLATKAKYDALKYGMSYEDAVKVIGKEGVKGYTTVYPAIPKVSEEVVAAPYTWGNSNGKWITAVFVNGKLTQKTQGGL